MTNFQPKTRGESLVGEVSISEIQIFAANFVRLILFRKTRSHGEIIQASSFLAQEILFLSVSDLQSSLKVSVLTLIGFFKDEVFFHVSSLKTQNKLVIRTADTDCYINGLGCREKLISL